MSEITVRITDTIGARTQKYRLSSAIPVARLVEKLVQEFQLAAKSPEGQPLQYHLYRSSQGEWLAPYQSLAELGIEEGEVLHLTVDARQPTTSAVSSPSMPPEQAPRSDTTKSSTEPVNPRSGGGTHIDLEAVKTFDIALAQRRVLWCFLASVCLSLMSTITSEDSPWSMVLGVAWLFAAFATIWCIAELTIALERRFAWLWLALAPIPCLGYGVVLWLVISATEQLKKRGARVGLMGASARQIRELLKLPSDWSKSWIEPGLCAKRVAIVTAGYTLTCCGWGMILGLSDQSTSAPIGSTDPMTIQRDATLAYWRYAAQTMSRELPTDNAAKVRALRMRATELHNMSTLNVDMAAVEVVVEVGTLCNQYADANERAGSASTYIDAFLRGMSGDIAGPGRELSEEQKALQAETNRIVGRLAYVRAALTSYYGVEFTAF